MKPVILTEPCAHCPFRNDRPGFLTQGRAMEIIACMKRGETFPCHKTLDYSSAEEMDDEPVTTGRTAVCAGYAILAHLRNEPPQIMQIAERLGFFDPRKLNLNAPVHRTAADFINAQPSK